MPSKTQPLSRFPFLNTDDLYTARKKQQVIWGRHKSRVIGGNKYHTIHNRAELPGGALNFLDCSSSVQAKAASPHDQYWLLSPIEGHLEIEVNGQNFAASKTRAVLQSPWESYSFRSTPTKAFILEISEQSLRKVLPDGFLGCFGYSFEGSFRNAIQQLLFGLAGVLDDWATGAVGTKKLPSFLKHLELAVLHCLVEAIRDQETGSFAGSVVGNMPLTAIRTFMNDNLANDLSVGDIAEAAGVSIRTLQKGFADHYFMSPNKMLTTMRLDKARELLKSRKGPASVGAACKAVGFGHAGRFSKEYADRFGETPSETLRQRIT